MNCNFCVCWSNMKDIAIVNNSGASRSITPIPSDFIGQISPMDAPIQGLSATTKIKGISTVKWLILWFKILELLFKQLLTTSQKQKSDYLVPTHIFVRTSLVHLSWIWKVQLWLYLINFDSVSSITKVTISLWLPIFLLRRVQSLWHLMSICIRFISGRKQSKSHPSAKETPKMALEIWSLGFQQIQSILGSSNQKEPIIMTIFTLTSSCPIPLCASCKIPHLTRRTPMSSAVSHNFSHLATLRRDDLTVGQKVSLDHMFHPLLDAYHKLRARNHLLCISPVERSSWNIAQKFIFIYIQVLLGTGELLLPRMNWINTLVLWFSLPSYYGDNGVFASQAY